MLIKAEILPLCVVLLIIDYCLLLLLLLPQPEKRLGFLFPLLPGVFFWRALAVGGGDGADVSEAMRWMKRRLVATERSDNFDAALPFAEDLLCTCGGAW